MAEMRSLLAFMDADDKAHVLRFYEKLFDEAGEDGEAALLKKLGSPVRQVLQVERSYRERKQAEEDAAYAAEPVTAEPVHTVEEQAEPEELSQPEEEPEELPELPEAEEEEPADAEEPEEEEADYELPYAGVISADTFAGELLEVPAMPEEEADAAASEEESDEPESPAADEPTETEDEDEGVTETVAPPEACEEKAEPLPHRTEEKDGTVGAGRVVAAVFVTIPMIVFVLLGICLSVVLGMLGLGPGALLGAAGGYLCGYAFGGVTAFLPDILLLAGGALLCFCLALFLLWLGLWLAVGGARLTVKITAAVYRGILKRGGRGNE